MQISSERLTILVIEDNAADVFLIEEMLRSSTLKIDRIYAASSVAEACVIAKAQAVDLLLLDLSLPDSFGMETLVRVKSQTNNVPVIILSGQSESHIALEALKQGAQDYLVKGEFTTALLVKTVQYSIERKKAEKEIQESEEKYRQLFNKNPFPTWIYDSETLHILDINEAAAATYGYSKEEFLNLSVNDLRVANDSVAWACYATKALTKEKLQAKYKGYKKKDGGILSGKPSRIRSIISARWPCSRR